MKHVISLGAGVQSSTMALMAAAGEISPMPDAAIFADTQAEPQSVYKWLDWLESQLPFPVYRTTKGNLGEIATTVRISREGNKYTKAAVPAFIRNTKGETGLLMRQCTGQLKIAAIESQIRRIRDKDFVTQWIGISTDEADRMKPAKPSFIANRWPLIEQNMSRTDCLNWMKQKGYPQPPRSSCIFCPFHSDKEWKELKANSPEDFEKAVQFERSFQTAIAATRKQEGEVFLHRSFVPLDRVNFSDRKSQFSNECEGVCGV